VLRDNRNYAELYREAREAQESYIAAQNAILLKADPELATAVSAALGKNSEIKPTFEDVELVIAQAHARLGKTVQMKKDAAKQKTFFGVLNRTFRGMAKKSKDAHAFVSLLPESSEFGSLLCGGLSVILKAAAKYSTMEENICHALEEIQRVMLNEAYANVIHPDDEQLHRRNSALCASVFRVLEYILHWVFKPVVKKLGSALLRPETYGEDLEDLVSEMKRRAQDVQDYADLLGHKSLKEVERKVGNTETDVGEIKNIVKRLERTMSHAVDQKLTEDQWRDRALLLLAERIKSMEMVFQRAIALGTINDLLGSESPRAIEYLGTLYERVPPEAPLLASTR
jgi:hypothetical protein